VETKDLIELLSGHAAAIRRLPTPGRRTTLWLLISVVYVAVVTAIHVRVGDRLNRIDVPFLIEKTAILTTAVTAALAAFSSVIPGSSQRILYLPLIPLAVWLASLGEGCVHDWLRLGAKGLSVRADWDCAPAAIFLSVVPAIAMVAMLRRGAPLVPAVTLSLGMLAVAAIVNFGLRIFHLGDVSIMVLVWHMGGAALVMSCAAVLGRYVLNWRSTLARSGIASVTGLRR